MRISINGSATMVFPSVPNAVADLKATKAEGFDAYWLAQVGLGDALTVFAAAGDASASQPSATRAAAPRLLIPPPEEAAWRRWQA